MNSLPMRLNGYQMEQTIKEGHDQGDHAPAQHQVDDRMVDADQQAVDRVGLFRLDLAADEPAHQDRHDGHGQERGCCHGIGLGVGKRLEQPPDCSCRAKTGTKETVITSRE